MYSGYYVGEVVMLVLIVYCIDASMLFQKKCMWVAVLGGMTLFGKFILMVAQLKAHSMHNDVDHSE
jgi:hypothetical protein